MAIAPRGPIEGRASQAMATVDMNIMPATAIKAVVNRKRARRSDIIIQHTSYVYVGYKSRLSVWYPGPRAKQGSGLDRCPCVPLAICAGQTQATVPKKAIAKLRPCRKTSI